MKIVVFTWDRYDTISTPRALSEAGAAYDVVCHSPEAYEKFAEAGNVFSQRLLVSNVPKGLANNRNWYIENHLRDGEWCLMLVDDWMHATELDCYDYPPGNPLPVVLTNTTEWKRKFNNKISMEKFLQRANELTVECHARDTTLGGFAGNDNALFRKPHFRRNALADGRAIVLRKTHLRFDPNAQMVDDVCFTAQTLEAFGRVLVNEWVHPYCRRYTQGGYGNLESRMEQRKADCQYLVQRFPGLITYREKPGWPAGSHVQIQAMRADKLRIWRLWMQEMTAARMPFEDLPFAKK